MKNLILTFLTLITLISCATIPSKKLTSQNFTLAENEGAIAGVIGILKRTYSSRNNIYYTNEEILQNKFNKLNYVIEIGTGAAAPQTLADFEKNKDDKYVYFFFVLKAKSGNYRFNEYSYFFNSGYIQENVSYPIKQNLEFKVEKGKIKYFGTFLMDSKNRELIFTNEFKISDLEKFKEKLPNINIKE